jgi:hypothetical protein
MDTSFTTDDYQRAKAVHAGQIKRLYLAGHNHKRGHAVALEFVDAPPVRYISDLTHARRLVDRFNRRYGSNR